MFINLDNEIKKLDDYRAGKLKTGLKLGISRLDKYLRFKYGAMNVVVGHSNVGKTSVLLYLMTLYSLKHNIRWLVYSSENETYTIYRKILEYLENEVFNKIPEAIYKERIRWIDSHFKFIDTSRLYSYTQILDLANQLKKAWDYQAFVIDPWNSLAKDKDKLKGTNSYEYTYEALSEVRLFCKQNNVSTYICTHAATEASRKVHPKGHDFENQPTPPSAASIEYGSMFNNRCDNMIRIHRYIYSPTDWMYSRIAIFKCKNIDTGGKCTPIDMPVLMKSLKNNTGFEIEGVNPIPKRTQGKIL